MQLGEIIDVTTGVKIRYSSKLLKGKLLERLQERPVYYDELPVIDYPRGNRVLKGDIETFQLESLVGEGFVKSSLVINPKTGQHTKKFSIVEASEWAKAIRP